MNSRDTQGLFLSTSGLGCRLPPMISGVVAALLVSCAPIENTDIKALSDDVAYPETLTMRYRPVTELLQRRGYPSPLDPYHDKRWDRLRDFLQHPGPTEYVDDDGNLLNVQN